MAVSRFVLLAALVALAARAGADLVAPHEDGGTLGASICASADADNWHFAHPSECNRFIKCDVANSRSSIITCPEGQLWNDAASVCDWAANVECKAAPGPGPRPPPPGTRPPRPRPPPRPTTTAAPPPPPPPPPTGDFARLCRRYNPHRYHVPHPSDRSKFYKCDWNAEVATEFDCPAGLVFNARIQVCDWA